MGSFVLTKLQAAKKNKKVHLYLDGSYTFSVPVDIVLESRLKVGTQLDDAQLAHLLSASWQLELYHRAVDYQTRRLHSSQEIQQYLGRTIKKWQTSPRSEWFGRLVGQMDTTHLQSVVLQRLIQRNHVNDEIFTREWIEARMRTKPRSPLALKLELRQKGVSSTLIDAVFVELKDQFHDQSQAAIDTILAKAWRSIRHRRYSQPKTKQILTQRLNARGFPYSTTKTKIDEFLRQEYNLDPRI